MKQMIFLLMAVATVTLFSCKKSSSDLYTVKYEVSSTSAMNVTYTDKNGVTQSATNVNSNWSYSFGTSTHGQIVKLTIVSVNNSPVSGAIFVNGQQSAQNNDNSGSVSVSAQIP